MLSTYLLPFSHLSEQVRRANWWRWFFILGGGLSQFLWADKQALWAGEGLVAVNAIVTLLFMRFYRSLHKRDASEQQRALSHAFFWQVFIDFIIIAVGIHVTGGPLSPLPMLYILYISVLSVIFPLRPLLFLNTTAIVLYAGLMEAYLAGWLQPFPPPAVFNIVLPRTFARGLEFLTVSAMILDGIMVSGRSWQIHQSWAKAEAQGKFLDRLNEIVRLSLTQLDVHQLYQILVEHLMDVMEADGVCLTRWDAARQKTWRVAICGQACTECDPDVSREGEKTLLHSLREAGTLLAIEDILDTPYISPEVAKRYAARSVLGLPLSSYQEKQFWGGITIAYAQPRRFLPEEIQRAQQAADIVSLLISRAHLYNKTIERAELLRELSIRMTHMTSDLQHETLLPTIVETSRVLLKSQRAALFLRDSESDRLTCTYSVGLSDKYINAVNALFKEIPGSRLLQNRPYVLVPDIWDDEQTIPLRDLIREEGINAYAIFALASPTDMMGALTVYWDQAHAISSEEVSIGRLFAERAGAILHSATLYAQATEQSLTDPLTELPNRRALDQRLAAEMHRAFRYKNSFTLVMIDLDGFKSINDNFGHPIGDSVLQQVAHALTRSLRATDFVARYGGDEFALILPETNLQTAVSVAEKLRLALAACDLHLPRATQRYLSACMGLANFPHDTNVPDRLIEIADRRLYRAKRADSGKIVASDKSEEA